MLVVRDAQMETFAQMRWRDFVRRARERAADFWPELPSATITAVLDEAFARARERGIVSEPDLVLYGDVALAFGPRFDSDARFPWAAKALDGMGNPSVRVARLYDRALERQNEAPPSARLLQG